MYVYPTCFHTLIDTKQYQSSKSIKHLTMFQLVTSPRLFQVNILWDELATIQTTYIQKDLSLTKTGLHRAWKLPNKLFTKPSYGGSIPDPSDTIRKPTQMNLRSKHLSTLKDSNKLNRNTKSKQHQKRKIKEKKKNCRDYILDKT